ncbi:MAG: succinate--CoA ligase subunit alpha [Candidatus Bathyarchaeia archaeon]|jgi:succinyl-CoA synthetase alpha subunit
MGILVDSKTRVIVQGITGKQGSFHTNLMRHYGTRIVAGVSPGKGGTQLDGVPVYDTVHDAQLDHTADASVIFVPALFAADAALEALAGGIRLVVIVTEHVPIKDAIAVMSYAAQRNAVVVGPNTPGVITPGKCKVGIMPSSEFSEGNVGILSRSGTLTYEIAADLTHAGLGQSTCVGVGGDPVTGLNFIEALDMFRVDPQTRAVTLIGEIGGNLEELTAQYLSKVHYPKPVVAYIAGRSAPTGRRMGHAGAIVMGKSGTAETKTSVLEAAGVQVAKKPSEVAKLLLQGLG